MAQDHLLKMPEFHVPSKQLLSEVFMKIYFFLFYVFESFLCIYVNACCPQRPKRVSGLLELELQRVVSAVWVLRIEPRSSVRSASSLNV